MIKIPSAAVVLVIVALAAAGCENGDGGPAPRPDPKPSPDPSVTDDTKIRLVRQSGPPTISRSPKQYESTNCKSRINTRSIIVSDLLKSEVSVEKRATAGAEAGITIPAALALKVKGEVESGYRTTLERARSMQDTITIEVPPWAIVTTKIYVETKKFASVVEFEKAGKVSQVPYRFTLQVPDLSTVVTRETGTCPNKPNSLKINPAHVPLEVGKTTQLRATLLDIKNNAIGDVTFDWQSDNNNVATVTKNGMVEAVGQGETRITAEAHGVSGRAGIKVTQTVARVRIEPANLAIVYGKTVRLIATAVDNRENVVSRDVRWSSQNEEIATVSPDGLVQGNWIGRTTVTATTPEGVTGTSEVTISLPTIAFPRRTLTLIVPFKQGGTPDLMARIISRGLSSQLHQSVVVKNIPGSSGTKGWKLVAAAKPDGYTMAIYSGKLRKRSRAGVALGDFKPVAMFTKRYGLLVPKDTHKEQIMVLENAVREAVADKAFQDMIYKTKEVPYYLESLKFSTFVNP